MLLDAQKVHWDEKSAAACVIIPPHAGCSQSFSNDAQDPTTPTHLLFFGIIPPPVQHRHCAARGVCSFDDVSFI